MTKKESAHYCIDWNAETLKNECGKNEVVKLLKDTIKENITR